MRSLIDVPRLREFMRRLGMAADGPGRVYLTGGACAVLLGWRGSTIDVDLSFAPERDSLFRAIPELKNALDVNVELAAPSRAPAAGASRPPRAGSAGCCAGVAI